MTYFKIEEASILIFDDEENRTKWNLIGLLLRRFKHLEETKRKIAGVLVNNRNPHSEDFNNNFLNLTSPVR